MGYTTEFTGVLFFVPELTAAQLAFVKSFLGEDWRDHPEWQLLNYNGYLTYVDLEFTDDFSGLQWSGAEKTYGMVDCVNLIISEARKKWPEFGLRGSLLAQGKDTEDRWTLVIGDDGLARRVENPSIGQQIKCPHCGQMIKLEACHENEM